MDYLVVGCFNGAIECDRGDHFFFDPWFSFWLDFLRCLRRFLRVLDVPEKELTARLNSQH